MNLVFVYLSYTYLHAFMHGIVECIAYVNGDCDLLFYNTKVHYFQSQGAIDSVISLMSRQYLSYRNQFSN